MNKETIDKPDGRYIIFYSFGKDEPEEEPEAGADAQSSEDQP
jgi:hypothetical protein